MIFPSMLNGHSVLDQKVGYTSLNLVRQMGFSFYPFTGSSPVVYHLHNANGSGEEQSVLNDQMIVVITAGNPNHSSQQTR